MSIKYTLKTFFIQKGSNIMKKNLTKKRNRAILNLLTELTIKNKHSGGKDDKNFKKLNVKNSISIFSSLWGKKRSSKN